MADQNPYAAPIDPTNADDPPGPAPIASGPLELASHVTRFVGAFVDGFLAWAIRWVVIQIADSFRPPMGANEAEARQFFQLSGLAIDGASVLLLGIQGLLIVRRGQSIGKMVARARIVRPDGSPAGFVRGFLLRTGPLALFTWLIVTFRYTPSLWSSRETILMFWMIVLAVDALLIFGASRRCAHDIVADTIVVRVAPSKGPQIDASRIADADDPPARRKKKPGATKKPTRKKTKPPPADAPS